MSRLRASRQGGRNLHGETGNVVDIVKHLTSGLPLAILVFALDFLGNQLPGASKSSYVELGSHSSWIISSKLDIFNFFLANFRLVIVDLYPRIPTGKLDKDTARVGDNSGRRHFRYGLILEPTTVMKPFKTITQ